MPNILKNKKINLGSGFYRKAFTLVELLVAVSIFMIITSVVLVNNSRFNDAVVLKSAAYEVALAIREAQNSALNVRSLDGSGFGNGFGVYIQNAGTVDTTQSTTYTLFSDAINVTGGGGAFGRYDTTAGGNDVDIKQYSIKRGFYITRVIATPDLTGATASPYTGDVDFTISFKRPDTVAYIYKDGVVTSGANFKEIKICLAHPSAPTNEVCVKVNKLGLIGVE